MLTHLGQTPWRKRVLFSTLPLCFLLGIGELTARFLQEDTGPPGLEMEPHPTRGWQLSEMAIDALGHPIVGDENGMRQVERTDAQQLILTTGDSSVFGHGLPNESTLHATLKIKLSELSIDADVMTGAAPGYTVKQSLVQLEEVGWSLSPSLIVIGNLWSDNDIVNNQTKGSDQGFEAESWLMRNSALWRWAAIALKMNGDPFETIGWMEDRHLEKGWRRVPLSDYARHLDLIFLEAHKRRVGVLVLQPCNAPMASGEQLSSGHPWDVYFEAMALVSRRRRIPVVSGCDVVASSNLSISDAFLDRMHPTAKLNDAYATAIAQKLDEVGWPRNPLLPVQTPPLFQDNLKDDWPSLIPNPNSDAINGPDVKGPPPPDQPRIKSNQRIKKSE